jgi:hypothetical protein
MPPPACSFGTAISTVGVVDKPKSTTSIPRPVKVDITIFEIISPDIRASLPTITLASAPEFNNHVPYAEANLTVSRGVKLSPGLPPIVPLIPEIDFINVKIVKLNKTKN